MGDTTTRKIRTPEERIADAKAQLEALEAKAQEASTKRANTLIDKRAALVLQVSERTAKIDEIEAELVELGVDIDDLDAPATPALSVVAEPEFASV